MTKPISANRLLAKLSGKVDEAELHEMRTFGLPVSFRGGALESVKVIETTGRALRVIKDGRLGFSTTTDMTDGTTLVRSAVESARYGDPAPFSFPGQQPTPDVDVFEAEVEHLDESGLISLGEEIVEQFRTYVPTLQVTVSLRKEVERLTLLNTSGLELRDRRTLFDVSIGVSRTQPDDILMLYDGLASRRHERAGALEMVERLIERLRWGEDIAVVESGAMPVVFSPQGMLSLGLPLVEGLSGRNVHLGASPLKGKLGQQVFDRRFSLIDDGTVGHAALSAPFDDEGTPTARKLLVEDGVVSQFLCDLRTAAQMGTQPTGNGFKSGLLSDRGFHLPPAVGPTSLLVPPGRRSIEDILASLDEALLVEQVIGLGQGNTMAGEFSNNVSLGFLVRRGEVAGRVKDTMIAGNAYELLRDRLIALGNRADWVFGVLRVPAIAVDGVGVASKG